MTKPKKVSFEAEWESHDAKYNFWIIRDNFVQIISSDDKMGRKIIRVIGKKRGKLLITIKRVK